MMPAGQSSQISLGEWAASQPVIKADLAGFAGICSEALQALDLPDGFASWQTIKAGDVLRLGKLPVLIVNESKAGRSVWIRTSRRQAELAGLLLDPGSSELLVEQMDVRRLTAALQVFFDIVIEERSSDRFACCSLYRSCSAAGCCVQTDRLLAIDCAYRTVLKKGLNYFA